MGRKKKRMLLALRQARRNKLEVVAEELAPANEPTPETVVSEINAPVPAKKAVKKKAPLRSAAKKTTKKP